MFYYFVAGQRMVKRESAINLADFPQYQEMTQEEADFWDANPTANITDVKLQVIHNPLITLDEHKQESISFLSELSLSVSNSKVPMYKIINALTSRNRTNDIQTRIYTDDNECDSILDDYNRIGKECRDIFYKYKGLIEACEDTDSVNLLVDCAQEEYKNI